MSVKRALCALLCACLLTPCFAAAEREPVRLLALNVGKADCLLLFVYGQTYLIDAGYEHTYGALQSALAGYGVTRLDGVFLTHAHEDHEGGLMPLASSDIQVDAWYASSIYYDVKEGKHPLVNAAKARGQEAVFLDAGDTLPLPEGATFTVLGPTEVDTLNENNNSLVLRLDSPDGSMLLAADMKEEEESLLWAAGALAPADVFKVGHHGDDKATSNALVSQVRPQVALISTSTREEPDTPAPVVIKRLESYGCDVYVTQDTEAGLLCTLREGKATVEALSWNTPPARGLTLAIDNASDLLTITNTGDALDLTGYMVYSTRGSDCFYLPEGTLLAAGERLTLGSGAGEKGDITLSQKRVWHKSKNDVAILYDAYAREIARTDNGLPE